MHRDLQKLEMDVQRITNPSILPSGSIADLLMRLPLLSYIRCISLSLDFLSSDETELCKHAVSHHLRDPKVWSQRA